MKNQYSKLRPKKIGNRAKHYGKYRKCPKKQQKHYMKHKEMYEEMGANMWGMAIYRDS